MTSLDLIREACVKANPEIVVWSPTVNEKERKAPRPIRLADVLLAIPEGFALDSQGYFCEGDYNGYVPNGLKWNLRNDSLESQSKDTIKFIASLLK